MFVGNLIFCLIGMIGSTDSLARTRNFQSSEVESERHESKVESLLGMLQVVKLVALFSFFKKEEASIICLPIMLLQAILQQYFVQEKGEYGLLLDFYHGLILFLCFHTEITLASLFTLIYLSAIFFGTDPYLFGSEPNGQSYRVMILLYLGFIAFILLFGSIQGLVNKTLANYARH